MSLDNSAKLSVKVSHIDLKSGSGVIYRRDDFAYILTAKHNVCPKDKNECRSKKRECNNCELKNTYKVKKLKITIEKPDCNGFGVIKPKDVISLKNKDLSILVVKEKDLPKTKNLPDLIIADYNELPMEDTYVSIGYPTVTGTLDSIPIVFDYCSKKGSELYFKISSGTSANLETTKSNMEAASGMGVLHSSSSLLAGIYVKTDDFKGSYSEYIDESVNELLIDNDYSALEFENKSTAIKNLITSEFMDCFEEIEHDFNFGDSRKLELYTVKVSGKNIEYSNLIDQLHECIHLFCLPRKVIIDMERKKKIRKLITEGDKVFNTLKSDDKITDIMLQGLLEAKYNTPKLYSIFDNNSVIRNVHFKYIDGKKWEMIHCVSKFDTDIKIVFEQAILKLTDCVINLEEPSKLVSSSIYDGIFTEEEKEFLISLLLPSELSIKPNIHDTYAVLVGFEFDASNINLLTSQDKFKSDLIHTIKDTVNNSFSELKMSLNSVESIDSEVKLFFIPFKDISSFKEGLFEGL